MADSSIAISQSIPIVELHVKNLQQDSAIGSKLWLGCISEASEEHFPFFLRGILSKLWITCISKFCNALYNFLQLHPPYFETTFAEPLNTSF
jgi:hypothetical protein